MSENIVWFGLLRDGKDDIVRNNDLCATTVYTLDLNHLSTGSLFPSYGGYFGLDFYGMKFDSLFLLTYNELFSL